MYVHYLLLYLAFVIGFGHDFQNFEILTPINAKFVCWE